jgi:Methylmalonyl-CoA mutase, N-terminal domain/subunit
MDELRRVCETRRNVMPVVMELTKEGATVTEVTNVYREVFGVWKPALLV